MSSRKFKPVLIAALFVLAPGVVQAQSSATCLLTNTCSLGSAGTGVIQDILDETKNCVINPSPSPTSCCQCSTTEANLKNYMNIHRKGGVIGQDSFLLKTYWEGTVNPGLNKFLSRIIQGTVTQNTAQGSFVDAQNNIMAISALQQGAAQASKNYLPSESLCRFGSLSQSLGADDMKSRVAQAAIAKAGLKRNLGSEGSIAAAGSSDEMQVRMNEFTKENCDSSNPGLALMCGKNSQRRFPNVAKDTRYNRDINYARTIDTDPTIDADFTGVDELTPSEQDVVSLSQNLYGHKQPSSRPTEKKMRTSSGEEAYMESRSVVANRSVALNTYAAIAGMKSRGSSNAQPYMKSILTQLGLGSDKSTSFISDKPSYYAQMDVLTKKVYQTPSFYANLMEGKTNVARQSSAMEGLELMQDRDIYNSMRRSEMLLALLVQLQAKDELKDVATQP